MTKKTNFIKMKLLSTFIILCLVPTLLISLYNYQQIKKQIERSTLDELESLAKIKSAQIERYFDLAKLDVSTIATSPYIVDRLKNSKLREDNSQTQLRKYLDAYIQPRAITEISILDHTTKVILSTTNDQMEIQNVSNIFSRKTDQAVISHIYKKDERIKDYFFMVLAPVLDDDREKIGYVIAEFKANVLFERIQDTTGLGETGETLLGQKRGDHVIFLNPLRHDPNAGMKRSVRLNAALAKPVQYSVRGVNGKGISIDYRGEPVLAAWRYIPTADWGIVAKIDEKEGFALLTSYKISIALVAFIIIAFGLGASWVVAQNLMHPIKEMDNHAHIDPLTRLPNRRLLMDTLELAFKKAVHKETIIGLMFLDLDGFKSVNDLYGHKTGDWLLQVVAQRLNNILRSEDMVARLGGDEFIILVNGTKTKEDIASIANKIIEILNEPFSRDGNEINIGASIGISYCNSTSCVQADNLLQKADMAMYEAKKSGKNCFRYAI